MHVCDIVLGDVVCGGGLSHYSIRICVCVTVHVWCVHKLDSVYMDVVERTWLKRICIHCKRAHTRALTQFPIHASDDAFILTPCTMHSPNIKINAQFSYMRRRCNLTQYVCARCTGIFVVVAIAFVTALQFVNVSLSLSLHLVMLHNAH